MRCIFCFKLLAECFSYYNYYCDDCYFYLRTTPSENLALLKIEAYNFYWAVNKNSKSLTIKNFINIRNVSYFKSDIVYKGDFLDFSTIEDLFNIAKVLDTFQ